MPQIFMGHTEFVVYLKFRFIWMLCAFICEIWHPVQVVLWADSKENCIRHKFQSHFSAV